MRQLAVALMLLTSTCGGEATPGAAAGPYVVTAIDYHFHDAHPSMPIQLGRALQFSNQGSNVHNVTFEDPPYARNVKPGERLTIDPISELLGVPGRYSFFCKFHADRGMVGTIVVTSE